MRLLGTQDIRLYLENTPGKLSVRLFLQEFGPWMLMSRIPVPELEISGITVGGGHTKLSLMHSKGPVGPILDH